MLLYRTYHKSVQPSAGRSYWLVTGMHALLLLLGCLSCCRSRAQGNGAQTATIYTDAYTTVEIDYNLSDENCTGGIANYFRYRIKGSFKSGATYVTFRMSYYNCTGSLYYLQYSIDIGPTSMAKPGLWFIPEGTQFPGKLEKNFYDAHITSTAMPGSGLLERPLSSDPQSISGPQGIFYGQQAKLTVQGGHLGTKANWVWYKDQCGGGRVGTGESIAVKPADNTVYFVRAEGKNNTTNCARFMVAVDKRSTAAQRIIADSTICKGAATRLQVAGGSLGKDAAWVWYSKDCGNDKIGTGETITVSPLQRTYYYVRAESPYNITRCTRIQIETYDSSLAPKAVTVFSGNTICEGESVTLTVDGGRLAQDALWKWYSNSCQGTPVGQGASLPVSPAAYTTYYVRGEGFCNTTPCASLPVYVNTRSVTPVAIAGPGAIYRTGKTLLTVKGGSLGTNAAWKWYKNSLSDDHYLGSGSSINVRIRKPMLVYVKAVGVCGESNSIAANITPAKTHRFNTVYSGRRGKFFHIGLGVGLEWFRLHEEGSFTRSTRPNETIPAVMRIDGLGIKGEMTIHPIIKEHFSLGFTGSLSAGTTPRIVKGGKATVQDTAIGEKYGYFRSAIEGELALGLRKAKVLVKLNRSFQSNDYRKDATGNFSSTLNYKYNHTLNTETVSAGVRLGRYYRSYSKRGNSFDIIYSLTRVYDDKVTSFSMKNYDNLPDWRPGLSLSWWRQSAFTLRFDMSLATKQRDMEFTEINLKDAFFGVQLIYNRNWFY